MGGAFHRAQGYRAFTMYRLQYPDGQEVPNSSDIEHLRRFDP
jgi:hypothetical protein